MRCPLCPLKKTTIAACVLLTACTSYLILSCSIFASSNSLKLGRLVSIPKNDFEVPMPPLIPNLLLGGAQKCGTTALYAALKLLSKSSNSVCFPNKLAAEEQYFAKELHFFDTNERWREGPTFFHKRYRHCLANQGELSIGGKQWRLDSTPSYMLFPERITSFYKKYGALDVLRIIFILREPVSREISWYKHKKRIYVERGIPLSEGNLTSLHNFWRRKNFGELLANNGNNSRNLAGPLLFNRGFYGPLLERWITSMPGRRTQILALSYAELLEDQVSVLKRIFGFLQLGCQKNISCELPSKVPIRNKFSSLLYNATETPCAYQDELARLYEESNQGVYQLLRLNPGPPTEERPFRKFKYKCDH